MRWPVGAIVAFAAIGIGGAQARPAPRVPGVRIVPLDCGRIDVADMDALADDESYKGVAKRLMVTCYLIRHPKGDLLWDAGLGDRIAGTTGVALLPGYTASVPVTLASQLRRIGVRPDRIRYLAFSHEHVDHIGNAGLFVRATWLLNRHEHRWTIAHDGKGGTLPRRSHDRRGRGRCG